MEFDVQLDPHHLERLGATAPITGITELIWNALDADAKEVKVEFGRNALDGIEEIRVTDDGHGMTHDAIVEGFSRLGRSWKQDHRTSPGGRALHGRDGRGRFLAAGLGNRIRWQTVAADPADADRHLYIEVKLTDLAHVEVSDPHPTDEPTGTRVLIDGFAKEPVGLGGDAPSERLTGTFGLYLQTHNARLFFDRDEVDPAAIQDHRAEYEIPVAEGDDALLVVIEWTRRVDRALYLCDEQGTPLDHEYAGIQAPNFEFTAYLQWTGFKADESLALAEFGTGPAKQLLDAARDQLRDHFKERMDERTRQVISDWQNENVYPFEGEPQTKAEEAAREMFDVVAVSASPAVNSSDKSGRRLSLRLLREALENDPGSLHRVLRDVLDLKQDRLDELSELLDRTPLTALIATSKEITDRLEFLKGLEAIVLGDESKHVKERSQLHRILASETWVFGEEYALAADDNSLTTVLKKHLQLLGREALAEDVSGEVLDAEGSRAIVDLMLARSIPQSQNRREHLVIELKAPKVAIGDEQATQIRRYADAVAGDSRFDIKDVNWDFVIVSGEVRGFVDRERKEGKTPYGHISGADNITIRVLTWAEVLEEAGHRLKFVQKLLDYQPDADNALAYLRKTHEKYLPTQLKADTNGDELDAQGPPSES